MLTLVIFNLVLIAIIICLLFTVKRFVKGELAERIIFVISLLITILFHYSTFIFLLIRKGDALAYLATTPNLILPIYPCNVVMWCAMIYGLIKNKDGKLGMLLSDYIFWFGLASTLVGMFANVDFIVNPTLKDFEVTKSIVAHATLLFNLLLIPTFKRLRPSFFRNMLNIFISVIAMYAIGSYCNLLFEVLVSKEAAYDVNSMFIIHSPFEAAPFLRYPVIAAAALVIYLAIFTVCDLINESRGKRWYNRVARYMRRR